MPGSKVTPSATDLEAPQDQEPEIPVKGEEEMAEGTGGGSNEEEASSEASSEVASIPSIPEKRPSMTPKAGSLPRLLVSGMKADPTACERTNIRQRLEAVMKSAPMQMNRSSELVPLTKQFEENRKHLRNLYAAALEYQKSLHNMNDKRIEMLKQMSLISEGTPLFDAIGKLNNTKKEEGEDNMSPSLEARVRQCASESEMQSKQFDASFLEYVSEWDHVASELITTELKEVGKLRSTRSHYEDKVAKLRDDIRDQEEKGKTVRQGFSNKLDRNEHKLSKAYDEHEVKSGHLCVLIEEAATNIGRWRDLLPLAKNYMQWEIDRCESEARNLGTLFDLIEMMEMNVEEFDAPKTSEEVKEE